MKILFAVGLGSFIGGLFRYLLAQLIVSKSTTTFPLGTLAVNIIGCFIIGVVYSYADRGLLSDDWKVFLATGLLGGFTTYSAFSYETFQLMKQGNYSVAAFYIAATIVIGLAATFCGFKLADLLQQ